MKRGACKFRGIKTGAVPCPKRGAAVLQLVPKLKESVPPPPPPPPGRVCSYSFLHGCTQTSETVKYALSGHQSALLMFDGITSIKWHNGPWVKNSQTEIRMEICSNADLVSVLKELLFEIG